MSIDLSLYPIVTCGHPFRDRTSGDLLILMIGCMDPAMEGATVTLVCPPQYALIGPNTTTCMGNGEWEPDPREVECKGRYCKCFVWCTITLMVDCVRGNLAEMTNL